MSEVEKENKSFPMICENFIDGKCNECELNEHKECNN